MEGSGENRTEQYIKKRGINDKARIQQVWLGVLAGLQEEDMDLYCLGSYTPKQRDYIRLALEEGMPSQIVKEQLCDPQTDPAMMLKKKREYFSSLDSGDNGQTLELVKEIEKQLKRNNEMAEFIKASMDERKKDIERREGEIKDHRKELEEEIARLNEQVEELKRSAEENEHFNRRKTPGLIKTVQGLFKRSKKKEEKKFQETEDSGNIFDILSKPEYSLDQMQVIMEGYKDGMSLEQIRRYANPDYTGEKMRELKECLLLLDHEKADLK